MGKPMLTTSAKVLPIANQDGRDDEKRIDIVPVLPVESAVNNVLSDLEAGVDDIKKKEKNATSKSDSCSSEAKEIAAEKSLMLVQVHDHDAMVQHEHDELEHHHNDLKERIRRRKSLHQQAD